jgi:hypothetical protein
MPGLNQDFPPRSILGAPDLVSSRTGDIYPAFIRISFETSAVRCWPHCHKLTGYPPRPVFALEAQRETDVS